MAEQIKNFGVLPDGNNGCLYEIQNQAGLKVCISNVAAAIVSVFAPDRAGKSADLVLGYDNAAGYLTKGPYHGAVIGRVTNRIEDAEFTLNGKTYQLEPNYKGKHVLHGGLHGLDNHVFTVSHLSENSVCLETTMEDGEDGFPGNVQVRVTYAVLEDGGLSIRYHAVSDADTVLNLTNHAYFNLSGQDNGSMLDQTLQIFASQYLPLNEDGMVYGDVLLVDDVMDFRAVKSIGRDIEKDHPQLRIANGYDHNYVLSVQGKELVHAARAKDETSGRVMDVFTNMPGILLYTGNYLEDHDVPGKGGRLYRMREGFCLETNFYPNALKYPQFPQPILKAGEIYSYETIYRFSVD